MIIREWIVKRASKIMLARKPDFVIGPNKADPYLERWWVIPRNKLFNIYLHRFYHSDDDRALHDHPWINLSWLLSGEYTEVTPFHIRDGLGVLRMLDGEPYVKRAIRRAGALVFRRPTQAHRVELHDGPVLTLFLTGPVVREWGFLCPKAWVPWRQFVNPTSPGQPGRGCGED